MASEDDRYRAAMVACGVPEKTIKEVMAAAYKLRIAAMGRRFSAVINEYYAARARGDRVTLKDLADVAGVNYDSLRQAKIRYDTRPREK